MKPAKTANCIGFTELPWAEVKGGGASGRMRRQTLSDGGAARILEVFPDWNEAEWCEKGHVAYLISGSLSLEFASQPSFTVRRGEGFDIPPGCPHKAKSKRGARLFIVD